jgi:deoxyribodipyrimidine photo-lyase
MYKKSLFIFRQDLRLNDNTGLIEAIKNSDSILPIFIRDERAVSDFWIDDPRFGFIREAIESIDTQLQQYSGRLSIYSWNPVDIITNLIQEFDIDAVFFNRSYSPKWKERDDAILHFCEAQDIDFHSYQDFILVEPQECEQRKVFTPYSMLWKKFLMANPERLHVARFEWDQTNWIVPSDRKEISDIITVVHHPYWSIPFGAERMDRDFESYDDLRNLPAIDGSTRLSPYIRFGVFSIREIYKKVQHNPTLLSEIIWREFWYQIAYYFPFTYTLEFQERRRSIVWDTDTESYLWKQFEAGKTGYPLVDAAIRQLYETNWMHNRLRMVVASFLTKNLWIDWRIWEKWFKKYLIDYDEAVNYGNWQWSASVGADPKPVRIFNPLLQSEKFDSEAKFIKKYIPELADIDPKRIHELELQGVYYNPIVNQKESAAMARSRYRWDL